MSIPKPTIVVAAKDTPERARKVVLKRFRCTGKNDNDIIQKALDELPERFSKGEIE